MKSIDTIRSKIVSREILGNIIEKKRSAGKKIIFTNCCFDILHRGHIEYLSQASDLGDCFVIGLNNDESVRQLKGESRPAIDEESRALTLASFEFVDFVGHSWFFRREWSKYFWWEAPFSKTFGEDIHFCAVLSKNGIRSACPPHPSSEKELWGSLYPERGIDRVAISTSKDRSLDYYNVVRHEISKGFKPILL